MTIAPPSAVRRFERLPEGLLTLAAIYGPNASGKSNILDALSWVSSAVRNSLRAWEDFVPREPFRFADYTDSPSVYEVDFILDGVRHIYSLQLNDGAILFEELLSYPERRPRQLFVREGEALHFRRGMTGVGRLRELVTPTTLILSLAQRLDLPELKGPARYISSISTPFIRRRSTPKGGRVLQTYYSGGRVNVSTTRLFLDDYKSEGGDKPSTEILLSAPNNDLMAARELLRFADLGIDDVQVIEQKESNSADRGRLELRLVHRSGDERALFELGEESDGTQMWFRLIGPVLAALRSGLPLLLDEIDASLHPALSARLLDLFRNPELNKRNAQLIFTTHDTTLLNELNRDEVWLTEKDRDGATSLAALAEFGGDRVRKSLNLERAYLQGRFGALPQLRESTLYTLLSPDEDEEQSALTGTSDREEIDIANRIEDNEN